MGAESVQDITSEAAAAAEEDVSESELLVPSEVKTLAGSMLRPEQYGL